MAKVRDVVKEKCDKIGALENEINGLRNRRPWAGESTSSDDIEFQVFNILTFDFNLGIPKNSFLI